MAVKLPRVGWPVLVTALLLTGLGAAVTYQWPLGGDLSWLSESSDFPEEVTPVVDARVGRVVVTSRDQWEANFTYPRGIVIPRGAYEIDTNNESILLTKPVPANSTIFLDVKGIGEVDGLAVFPEIGMPIDLIRNGTTHRILLFVSRPESTIQAMTVEDTNGGCAYSVSYSTGERYAGEDDGPAFSTRVHARENATLEYSSEMPECPQVTIFYEYYGTWPLPRVV